MNYLEYLFVIGGTIFYIALGISVKMLFQQFKHSAGDMWITYWAWPIPLLMGLINPEYFRE